MKGKCIYLTMMIMIIFYLPGCSTGPVCGDGDCDVGEDRACADCRGVDAPETEIVDEVEIIPEEIVEEIVEENIEEFEVEPIDVIKETYDDLGLNTVHIHLFWSPYCKPCVNAKEFLETFMVQYPNLNIHMYDISNSSENDIYLAFGEANAIEAQYSPLTVICDQYIMGFSDDGITGAEISYQIEIALQEKCNNLYTDKIKMIEEG